MHHNALLVAAGLLCSPIFAAPNVNNRLNPGRGHRHRQEAAPILSVGLPYKPPTYGPPDDASVAAIDTSTAPPDSTSTIYVDPVLPVTSTSACSVIRITEYITVYGTSSSTASPGNFTSAPYGWNSSVTSSWLLTGTSVATSTSEPYFPISNSTTSTSPFGTDGTSAPTFVNVTTTVNVTVIPTSTLLVPSNFTSFPNISTPDVTLTPIPTSSVDIPGNFTSFANITSTPEISILPIPTTSFANSTTAEEPTSSDGPTVTSIIILPTETTAVISSSVTTITSLVIDTTVTPIDVASSTLTSFSTSPTLVIVTTVTPIATASFTLSDLPTTVVTATNTVSSGDAPTGTPSPQDIHCGIRGTPLGTYYLATYAFNKANVAVTLQGCFQFCSIAVERCYSYEFYLEPGLQAPRCKLYGGVVAYEVTSIDPFQPYQWFDLACGDPTKFT